MTIDLEKTGVKFSIKPHKKVKIIFREYDRSYGVANGDLCINGYWDITIIYRKAIVQKEEAKKIIRISGKDMLEYEFKVAKMIEALTGDADIVRRYDY